MKSKIQITVFVAFLFATLSGATYAEVLTKTFEFGLGTANTISNKRTFQVPCHAGIEGVSASYQRKGTVGQQFDIPITMELRSPGATVDEEGPIVDSVDLKATLAQQISISTKLLKGDPSPRGCSLPWVVRVKPQSGTAQFVVSGTITLSYFRFDADQNIEGGLISLNKGNTVTKNVGSSAGLHAGKFSISGTWLHSAFGVPGPLPVLLKFELLNPNGQVVASKTAYSNAEINPCCSSNKMTFSTSLDHHVAGQWKIRITNNSNDDTMNIDPKVKYIALCP
jgi:hypothetical protein